jgi:taurine dioxygenase
VSEDISFERVTGAVGALVHGVDIREAHPADTASRLREALHQFGVLFFESGQLVEPHEFQAFVLLFGEPERRYTLTAGGAHPDDADSVIDSDLTPMDQFRVNHWHTDGTALECPPQAAMLTPVALPDAGGDTMWASMYAAWEGLSSEHQNFLEGLDAVHSTARLPFLPTNYSTTHPVVIRDPVTKRKLLYVNSNYTERIVGMNDDESDTLLNMLFEHINTPEFHVRLRWRIGTIAVWEERVTQHRGVADFAGPRRLRRLVIPGDRPGSN